MFLPRAVIPCLELALGASLCFGQDQPKAGKDVQPAKLIYRISPDYPDAWKRQGLQGTVHLQAVIAKMEAYRM
jgi:hypothetical protein